MYNHNQEAVVVGIDHSPSSQLALQIAVEEAGLQDLPLRIVHAYDWVRHTAPPSGGFPIDAAPHPESFWEPLLIDSVAVARNQLGTERVSGVQIVGQAFLVLLQQSQDARMVVVGNRGHTAAVSSLIGSVCAGLIAECTAPVIVARPYLIRPDPDVGVVLGIDGSAMSDHAIAFAFEEAAARDLPLVAVRCWEADHFDGRLGHRDDPPTPEAAPEQELWLAESLAGYAEKYPDVTVIRKVVKGRPAWALTTQSLGAQLIVVGSRGHGGRTGLVLGSVSQSLLHHAHCPVAVVKHQS